MPILLEATIRRFRSAGNAWQPDYEARIEGWLDQQLSRCTDGAFAALFADAIHLPGVIPQDYLQKLIAVPGGDLLGGIRFYGQDITRPFVELLAWTGPIDLAAWRAAIAVTWAKFQPTVIRILTADEPAFSTSMVDQTFHAGRFADVALHPVDAAVSLRACRDPAHAARLVAGWYRDFARSDPIVAREVQPADEVALAACLATGSLDVIEHDGTPAGLIATEPGTIDWLHGQVMIEEIVAPSFRGRGFGRQAQTLLAARLQQQNGPDGRLIGTIHRLNAASHRTAIKAARPPILTYRFIDL